MAKILEKMRMTKIRINLQYGTQERIFGTANGCVWKVRKILNKTLFLLSSINYFRSSINYLHMNNTAVSTDYFGVSRGVLM